MKLYYSRNFHPRLAVAVARYLGSPVDFIHATPLAPSQQAAFRLLNPNLRLPILEDDGRILWETDAIACRMSQRAGSEFWRTGDALPEMIKWLSWGREQFIAACDKVHFERVTKARYGLGPQRDDLVDEGMIAFAEAATLLDETLCGCDWLVGDGLSYADFRMACVLPFADIAGLPLNGYPNICAWYGRLCDISAWSDPFANLLAPELPPVPGRPEGT